MERMRQASSFYHYLGSDMDILHTALVGRGMSPAISPRQQLLDAWPFLTFVASSLSLKLKLCDCLQGARPSFSQTAAK